MSESEQDAVPANEAVPYDDDATVVRAGRLVAEVPDVGDVPDEGEIPYDDDATVVRPVRGVADAPKVDAVSDDDAEDDENENENDDDATVVRSRPVKTPTDTPVDTDDDLTVVRPRFARAPGASAAGSSDAGASAAAVHPPADEFLVAPAPTRNDFRGDPVPEPESGQGRLSQFAPPTGVPAGAGSDPEPHRDTSGALRRAANFMPRVYGPRPVAGAQTPATEAPAAGGVAALNPRSQLPSVARRDRRARVYTLAGYAAAVCVTGVGLWCVATLAFAA